MKANQFLNDTKAEMPAKTIVLFLIVVVIAGALLPTIAQSMKAAAANTAIAAVPGATVVLPLVSLMAIIILLMFGIKKAFGS
jgi:hypothetical protein